MIKVAAALSLALLISAPAFGQRQEQTDPGTSYHYKFVSDVTIPDGTAMSPGQGFTKTWRIRNSGPVTWSGCKLVFADGAQMGAPSAVSVPPTPPGESVDISVPMTAPTETGHHRGTWDIRAGNEEKFGSIFVLIRVEGSTYKGRAFEDWEADLKSYSPAVRKEAFIALDNFGPRGTAVFIKVFQSDPDEEMRRMALAGVIEANPMVNEAVQTILRAITDPDPTIGMFALMAALEVLPSRIGPETLPVLVEAMSNDHPKIRETSIQLLVGLGPSAKLAAPNLRELAEHDPDPQVRESALAMLKLIETP